MPTLFRGIGWRIFFSFSVLLVTLTLIYSFVALKFVQRTASDNAKNELRVLSVTLSEQLGRFMKRAESGAKSLSAPGSVLDLELQKDTINSKKLNKYLDTKLSQLRIFESLSVFSTSGLCVGSTEPDWIGLPAQRESFFITGLKHFSFAEIFENQDQEKVLLVSTPINESNDPHGVLVARIKLSYLYDLMGQHLGLRDTSEAFLLDSKLRFITPSKSGPDEFMQSHLASTPLEQHLQDEFWVGEYRNYRGAEVLGTVVRLAGNRWYLVVEREFAEVLEQVSKVKQAPFGSTLVVLFVLIFVTVILTTSITRPLQRLVESARRIAAGELSNPVAVTKGSDEIAFLAAEFDRMRGRVAASQGRLIEQLEESEQRRLESERLAAIGTLASSLAHEIRNPLNGLSLLLSQLERSKQSDEQKIKMIDEMRGEIGRLDRLVSDILDYARPLQLQKERVGLRTFTENIINFYKGIFEEKNIQLKLNFPADEIEVEMDRDKLRQAFVNLIQNSIEAMAQGGLLSFSVELFDRGVRWSIKDSGVGMDLKSQSRLFDLFFTTKEGGTGLGLSVVKKIIDAHGGKTEVSSALRKGTEIRITFDRV